MSIQDSDIIPKKRQPNFSDLKLRSRKRLVQVGIPIVFLIILSSLLPAQYGGNQVPAQAVTQRLQELDVTVDDYLSWLKSHGIQSEVSFFHAVSENIMAHGADIALSYEQNRFTQYYLGLLGSILRLVFLFTASLRLWIVLFAAVVIASFKNWTPYRGRDLLGTTGNGKLFFSGILSDLSRVTKDGKPDILIPGLACPKMRPAAEVAQLQIGKVLRQYQAFNKTTAALAGIIAAYPEVPFFASTGDSQDALKRFSDPALIHGTTAVLSAALRVHAALGKGVPAPHRGQDSKEVLTMEEYNEALEQGLFRSLTGELRDELSRAHPSEVAAAFLAFQAGKVLSYIREGDHWSRRTAYTNLSARAVLHSIPAFSDDYTYASREEIRKALVYAMRFSVFGPIRLPVEISVKARALRQWVELLMAFPHELRSVIDELDFFAHAHALWAKWEQELHKRISTESDALMRSSRVTDSGVLFITVQNIISLFRSFCSPEELSHLEQLVGTISQVQRIGELSRDLSVDASQDHARGPLPQYQKIFLPLSPAELQKLSAATTVPADMLKEWLVVRNIFHTFGWLARQVGSGSVPEHSVVLAAYKGCQDNTDPFLPARGVVPLRGSYLEHTLGRYWHTRFLSAQSAIITDSPELFEKILRGIDVYALEEVGN